jgi:hypothetical protein
MMRLTMLVAVRRKRPLMQLVRLMQNLLVILLTLASMNRTMPLYPRIMLMPSRHLMRVTRMIGRLLHPRPTLALRHHRTLIPHVLIRKIMLPRMMKPSHVLSHHITSLRRRRRVSVTMRQTIPIRHRPTRLRVL